MIEPITATISLLALGISAVNAWLTLFRRGTVKMTQPTVIFFGPDSGTQPKVFLRTLLFATSKRGRVVQSMHLTLSRSETQQNFNVWVYGDERLVRGSGLFVGETGIATNHHFLLPKDGHFQFTEGLYRVDVFAALVGDSKRKLLFSQNLEISAGVAAQLAEPQAGVYFDWGPDSSRYLPYVDKKPPRPE